MSIRQAAKHTSLMSKVISKTWIADIRNKQTNRKQSVILTKVLEKTKILEKIHRTVIYLTLVAQCNGEIFLTLDSCWK